MNKTYIRDISPEDFYFNIPLYKKLYFEDTEEDKKAIFKIIFYSDNTDWHCPKCEKEVTYSVEPNWEKHPTKKSEYGHEKSLIGYDDFNEVYGLNYYKSKTYRTKYFTCLRSKYDKHIINFWIRFNSDHLCKIGQYPAMIEIEQFANRKYQKALKSKYKDYNRAIGLYQHEIGVGAMIYLRRIFEDIVFQEFNKEKDNLKLSEKEFIIMPMDKKIDLLKHNLPAYLIQNQKIYGILSKGVHQLSEEECLKYFNPVRVGLDLILNERNRQIEEKKIIKANEKELSDIKKEIEE